MTLTRKLFTLAVFACGLLSIARADVKINSTMRSGGFKGMGAFNGQSQQTIKGLKSRSDSSVKYESALMRMAAGGDRGEIIRVDLDKVWTLNVKKKTYTERSISHPPAKPDEEAADKNTGAKESKPEEKPTHRLKKAEFTVKNTGEKKEINGFKTVRYEANAIVEVEEIATKEVTTFLLNTNIWTTPWTKPLKQAHEEHMKFAKAYAEKMGLSFSGDHSKQFDATSVALLLGVGGAKTNETLAGLRKKIDTIEGYPIATETIWTAKEDPHAVAREQEAKARAKAEDKDDEIDTSGGAKSIASGLMGNFAKKKFKEHQEKADAKRAAQPLLSTYYEVKSIESNPLEDGTFEVPAGFRKS